MNLQSGKIKINLLGFLYYFLVGGGVFISLFFIFQGLADPFGELKILSGTLSLLLFPLLLKFLFTFLFRLINNDKS